MALLLSACSEAGKAPPSPAEFDALTVEQSACLFNCPAFKVEIFSDGRVRHSGPAFAYTGGPHESRIDRRGLERIARALADARIDDMRDRYEGTADGCTGTVTDMSTLTLHVGRKRRERDKSVELYTGCYGPAIPTDRVNALIKAIDEVTGTGALLERQARPESGGAALAP